MAINRLGNHTRLADSYLNPFTFVGYRNHFFSLIQILYFERYLWVICGANSAR